MTDETLDSQALVTSIGEHCVLYFGKENLQNLLVEYTPALQQTTIHVALREQTDETMENIFLKYIDEIVPLFASETMLDLRFFATDSPVFTTENYNSKSKTYAMA